MAAPLTRFSNVPARVTVVVACSVYLIIALSMLLTGEAPVFAVVLLLLALVLGWRGWRHTRVVCGDRVIRLYGLLRTRTFRIDEVERVEVRSGQTGMNSGRREYLTFVMRDGRDIRFKEFNASLRPTRDGQPNPVQRAATEIQRLVQPR